MRNFVITLAASCLLLSCKTATKATSAPVKTTPTDTAAPVSNTALFSKVAAAPKFSQVKINSRIDVQTGSYVPTADAVIYIENGKKVWLNVSAAFLNVARGIATPAGVKGYEKLGRTYIDSDFEYLNQLLNVNFINYSTLQNLLTGKTFIPVSPEAFTVTQNAQGYNLTSKGNQKITVNGKTSEYQTALHYTPQMDLAFVNMTDARTKDSFTVEYADWNAVESERFPANVKIIIKGSKNSQILIQNTKFDGSAMDTPYAVPSSYKKKEF